ncbi:MAG: hypothetical protein Q8Q09_19795, partial [Deltaproteobacteria bacterium]|nr:hypothetical protein [Deltaproteobacteria bacterium]
DVWRAQPLNIEDMDALGRRDVVVLRVVFRQQRDHARVVESTVHDAYMWQIHAWTIEWADARVNDVARDRDR